MALPRRVSLEAFKSLKASHRVFDLNVEGCRVSDAAANSERDGSGSMKEIMKIVEKPCRALGFSQCNFK